MKLRIQGNSLRLRLAENEVEQFNKKGQLSDEITFGLTQKLVFQLLKSDDFNHLSAVFTDQTIQVFIPELLAKNWTQTDLVGLTGSQDLPKGQQLHILIEKDFPCAHKTVDKQAFT